MIKFKDHIKLVGKNILVVEDSTELRNLMSSLLSYGGARVIEACNGKECLDIISSEKIDIVLMDIHMPGMDGITASRIIKNCDDNSSVPIVLISADHEKLAEFSRESVNVEGYIYKPFSPTDILQRTVKALSRDQ